MFILFYFVLFYLSSFSLDGRSLVYLQVWVVASWESNTLLISFCHFSFSCMHPFVCADGVDSSKYATRGKVAHMYDHG